MGAVDPKFVSVDDQRQTRIISQVDMVHPPSPQIFLGASPLGAIQIDQIATGELCFPLFRRLPSNLPFRGWWLGGLALETTLSQK